MKILKKYNKIFFIIIILLLNIVIVNKTQAKTYLHFDALAQEDDIFSINLVLDTDENINASSSLIGFDKDKIEIISVTNNNSIFNLWIKKPTYSNKDGVIKFIAGNPNNFYGQDGKVINIKFKARNVRNKTIGFKMKNSLVLASDGRGTNVLDGAFDKIVSLENKKISFNR